MTPLAQQCADAGLLSTWSEVHCFEITELHAALLTGWRPGSIVWQDLFGWVFLPADTCLFEWQTPLRGRQGFVLSRSVAAPSPRRIAFSYFDAGPGQPARGGEYPLWLEEGSGRWHVPPSHRHDDMRYDAALWHRILIAINTPQIVDRLTHMPDPGAQRAVANRRGAVGRYPLQAWTEVKLACWTVVDAQQRTQEIWLSGRKPLHFVREHRRRVLGQWTRIPCHWRGDAAIGIKQTRYRVEPKV